MWLKVRKWTRLPKREREKRNKEREGERKKRQNEKDSFKKAGEEGQEILAKLRINLEKN